MKRRGMLGAAFGVPVLWAWSAMSQAQGQAVLIEVWKSPSCGCCKDWISHLEANGFRVKSHDVGNTSMRARLRIPQALGSCHTAWVGGYAIEGHVPAADIRRLLRERPDAIGLAVPGMPIGSPGMDGAAYDHRQDPYDVLLVAADGRTRIYNSYFRRKGSV